MSTVQAHGVIKFRFIRLISILIKTLTPPYAIKNPRRLFFPRGARDGQIYRMDKSEGKRKGIDSREKKMSSATAAECDSASKHQLTSPDNNGKGLISILCIAQDCTSPLSQQQLRSSSGKVKMEITLCSCSPPLMNLISPHYTSLHSVSLIQNNTPSALVSPLSGGKQRRALWFLSLFFKRNGPVTLLSPSFPLRVIHTEAFALCGRFEAFPSNV